MRDCKFLRGAYKSTCMCDGLARDRPMVQCARKDGVGPHAHSIVASECEPHGCPLSWVARPSLIRRPKTVRTRQLIGIGLYIIPFQVISLKGITITTPYRTAPGMGTSQLKSDAKLKAGPLGGGFQLFARLDLDGVFTIHDSRSVRLPSDDLHGQEDRGRVILRPRRKNPRRPEYNQIKPDRARDGQMPGTRPFQLPEMRPVDQQWGLASQPSFTAKGLVPSALTLFSTPEYS
ncbi:hypothetical protein P170DRAFT_223262 [Aspergillus steynii IBT 23096]|uniref:Uncharacterized protein n=1 Tax=Aspergillus steynii IBT 23096 TaxID=1392250 RepID=A0A2I2G1Q1_9EURO|nr:uncharacterized protein P170DRAFT_223262 [Aspergillus steynii IBT 23096]PLB46801.1 hypothetical protein P170DRAFT_223262 [Aspergillus steynii IBT 23096]